MRPLLTLFGNQRRRAWTGQPSKKYTKQIFYNAVPSNQLIKRFKPWAREQSPRRRGTAAAAAG